MKNRILTFLLVAFVAMGASAQDVFGKWRTIDDETGEAKSIVEIYQNNGKVYGKVIEILNPAKKNSKCDKCPGADQGKPIEGLVILKDLKKDGAEYSGGTIMDPNNGKVYKALIALEGANKLKVRGYVGFSLLGRSQYWERVK
ncbi:MAG TPA: DUF2147 domain-containing protein [Flavobacteriaceae bacterium]|nr:DUF2147 domain-containing protein [Flavobacteriaceae bacterium]